MKLYLLGVSIALVLSGCGGGGGSDSGSGAGTDNEDTPTGQVTNSSACFNGGLYAVGTKVTEEYSVVSGNSQPMTESSTTEITQITTYRGYTNAIEETTQDGESTDNRTYIVVDTNAGTITTIGQVLDSKEFTYRPSGLMIDYALDKGEKKTYSTVTEFVNNVQTTTMDYSMEFLRSEEVTVPAGTFDACVMALTFDVTDADGTQFTAVFTQHIGVGNGITLKETFETTRSDGVTLTGTDELVSATINGKAI
ncbi:hypothetical protein [Enterovibrio calviensis]|uniref:hypothetical protein n=1 Tax=Enterovibrio calviensis TaxID=91359 RepID=UPI000480E7B3|nr:hypothetical protein [Enterovibrio calviensis]